MKAASTQKGGSFYRGEAFDIMPRAARMYSEAGIEKHILKGWMPREPFIGPTTNIVAFGSCFAANIGRYLTNLGFDVSTKREGTAHVQKISDGLVNVFAIAQQFEWAWENRVPVADLWHGWDAEEFGYDDEVRLATKKLFDDADVFILTFGLSEIWYDEPTGEVFWRAVPKEKINPSRHKFRVATHEETVERLQRIYDLIRNHRPEAAIVFTLSPVGLAATFRDVACATANSVSKARLRSAIDEVHQAANDPRFFYFPSYEVVINGFSAPFHDDLRHPRPHVIDANMKAFERFFCSTTMTKEDYMAAMAEARAADTFLVSADEEQVAAFAEASREKLKAMKGGASVSAAVAKAQRIAAREQRRRERDARIAAKRTQQI